MKSSKPKGKNNDGSGAEVSRALLELAKVLSLIARETVGQCGKDPPAQSKEAPIVDPDERSMETDTPEQELSS